jgi:hypothetical protein
MSTGWPRKIRAINQKYKKNIISHMIKLFKPHQFGLYLFALILISSACQKLSVKSVDFNVTEANITVHAGVPFDFKFSGNPDMIVFYSGEDGSRFENKGRITAEGKPHMQFNSTHTVGTDQGSLSLLVSTNFSGVYDSVHVKSATWTDITPRAKLATNTTATASGPIDLSDFLAQSKTIFVAFKCASKTSTWTITNFNNSVFNNVVTADNSLQPIADITTSGWINVNFFNPLIVWKPTATNLSIAASNAVPSVNWAISLPLQLDKAIPDVGTTLKDMTIALAPFTYTYNTTGTYNAVFVATNVNAGETSSVTRQVKVTVIP